METLADKIQHLGRKCQKCGHEWLKKDGAPEPARCPNHSCRTKQWRTGPEAGDKIKLREPRYEPFED